MHHLHGLFSYSQEYPPPVHYIKQCPNHSQVSCCMYQLTPLPLYAIHQSPEEIVGGSLEIDDPGLQHVDRDRIHSDHCKKECPAPESPDINDQVKNREEQQT